MTGPDRRAAGPLVLADLDNTLLDRAGAFRRWAETWALRRGLDLRAAVAVLVEADADGYGAKADVFETVRDRFGLADSAAELEAEYWESYPTHVRLDRAVADALVRLRAAGRRIVVVTNGSPAQERKLHLVGLDQLVDGWVISEVFGVAKPEPAIFEAAAALVGADLADAWMVGDHPVLDIGGAARLGLRTVWIHRGRPWPDLPWAPDAVCVDMAHAAAVILAADEPPDGRGA